MPTTSARAVALPRRLALLGLSLAAGVLACAALLLAAARPVWAAPTATTHNYPGAAPCDTSLQACIDGASPGDTIVITAGTYITSFSLSQPVSLTGVASNTVILQALLGQRVMTVPNNALYLPSVVISGLTFVGGNATSGSFPANCGGGIYLGINNSPLIYNVTISRNVATVGGGLCADTNASVRLENSVVLSNTANGSTGGGVRATGPVTITGGRFEANACYGASCTGGAVLAFNTLAITNAHFLSNTAQGNGGAVWSLEPAVLVGGLFQHNQCAETAGCDGGAVYAEGSLTATGTQFISNTAHARGGAVRALSPATFTSVLFQDNVCLVNASDFCLGGALYSGGFGVTLSATQFLSNTALWRAGAVYAAGPAVMTGGLLRANTCTHSNCNAGAMLVDDTLSVSGTQFTFNSAGGSGGGLVTVGPATLTSAVFYTNTCTVDGCQGGGLFAYGSLALVDTQFLTNAARMDGAGLVAVTTTVTGGLFQGNTCAQAACDAAALLSTGPLSVTGTQFISNTARQRAGAVYANGAAAFSGALFQHNRCTESDCEGGGLYAAGALTADSTSFISNTSVGFGGGAYVFGAATLTGGAFERNTCTSDNCRGGGVFAFGALTLTSPTFLTNTSRGSGGAAYAGGAAALSGGLFRANTCTQDACFGAGLYASGNLLADGTQFLSNAGRSHGGGAYAGGAATVSEALIQSNACSQNLCSGGGLYAAGTLSLTDTPLLSNTARSHGGGAFAFGAASVSDGLFQGNTCTQDNCSGGGLYVQGTLSLSDTDLISNTTREDGGGAWAGDDAVLTGGLFERNTCAQLNCQGGGLYAVNNLTMSGTTFLNNAADFSAGGVYANAGAHAAVTGGLFQGNTATRGGGMHVNGSLALTGTTFLSNAATEGGGLFTNGPATVTNALFRTNTAMQGGAFFHGGGAGQLVNSLFANNTATNTGTALYVNGTGGHFSVLHATMGMQSSDNVTPALTVFNGSVGITNTIIVYHHFGIVKLGGTVYQDYNAFLQVGFTATGGVLGGAHSVTGSPAFDHEDGHFRLLPGSKAVNAGVNAGVTVDYFGQPRPADGGFDIGYHEAVFLRVFLPLVRR